MPKVTIWIREDDKAKWDKAYSPEWLHKVIRLGYKEYELGMHPMIKPVSSIPKLEGNPTIEPFPNYLDKKKGTRK